MNPLSSALRVVVLDFDGVVLESVDVKTNAFRRLFAHLPCVDAVVAYHERHPGVSRYEKFRYIYEELLHQALDDEEMKRLDREFGLLAREGVVRSAFVPGAREFLETASGVVPVFVASATPEQELRDIVEERRLTRYFQGIFGSPLSKTEHLHRIVVSRGVDARDVLFVGDAASDRDAAMNTGVGFLQRHRPGTERLVASDADIIPDLWPLIQRCGLRAAS